MSISVFKLFYKHNTLVKESYMGFRACELNRSENQFSPVTSLRFLNHRRWPVPSFSGTYFVCTCEHIFLTRYNELFLEKGTKIAIKFLHKSNIKKSRGDWLLHLSGCKSCSWKNILFVFHHTYFEGTNRDPITPLKH